MLILTFRYRVDNGCVKGIVFRRLSSTVQNVFQYLNKLLRFGTTLNIVGDGIQQTFIALQFD